MTGWNILAVIASLSALGIAGISLIRMINGSDSQRQIEPTAVAAIQEELRRMIASLSKLDREMGSVTSTVDSIRGDLAEMKNAQRSDVAGIHGRIGGISRELEGTAARVEMITRHMALKSI